MAIKHVTIAAALLAILLAGCAAHNTTSTQEKTILVTFYPLLDITKELAGPDMTVETLIPPGVEAHEYEPKVSDMRKIDNAFIFMRIGLEWAPMEERIMQDSGVPSVVVSENITLLHADASAGGAIDPHIWLSPKEMMIVARNIANGLITADPAHANTYQDNLKAVESKLQALDDTYRTGLSSCAKDTIIVSHLAFSYVAHDYGFGQVGLAGLNPAQDIDPGTLGKLVDLAHQKDIHYVLYEQLVDPRISQTLATEVGAKALQINHIDVQKQGEDYYSQMQENLQTLRTALECQ
jgi:zinc transport system substrate-binding protein